MSKVGAITNVGTTLPGISTTGCGAPSTAKILSKREADANNKFSAFFLQTSIEAAMPKRATAVYGSGFAGDVMRSMLSERIATEIAKRGVIPLPLKASAPSVANSLDNQHSDCTVRAAQPADNGAKKL